MDDAHSSEREVTEHFVTRWAAVEATTSVTSVDGDKSEATSLIANADLCPSLEKATVRLRNDEEGRLNLDSLLAHSHPPVKRS
jgi:hypothetical protein